MMTIKIDQRISDRSGLTNGQSESSHPVNYHKQLVCLDWAIASHDPLSFPSLRHYSPVWQPYDSCGEDEGGIYSSNMSIFVDRQVSYLVEIVHAESYPMYTRYRCELLHPAVAGQFTCSRSVASNSLVESTSHT